MGYRLVAYAIPNAGNEMFTEAEMDMLGFDLSRLWVSLEWNRTPQP
jgi:hypothetical protein